MVHSLRHKQSELMHSQGLPMDSSGIMGKMPAGLMISKNDSDQQYDNESSEESSVQSCVGDIAQKVSMIYSRDLAGSQKKTL